jgi:hypothetical protein
VHVDSDVQLVELWDAEEKSTRSGEMMGRGGDECGQGAKGVEAIGDVDKAFLIIIAVAGACAD